MEVVGVVLAVPPLLVALVKAGILVQECGSRSGLASVTKGLAVQLKVLHEIVAGIERRLKAKAVRSDDLQQLGPIFKELQEELATLNQLLSKAVAVDRKHFLSRAKFRLFGFDKQVKEHCSRIETLKTLLTFKLTDGIYNTVTGITSNPFCRRVSLIRARRSRRRSRFPRTRDQRGLVALWK